MSKTSIANRIATRTPAGRITAYPMISVISPASPPMVREIPRPEAS